LRRPTSGLGRRVGLGQRKPRMVEKGPTGSGQFRSLRAAIQELNADLVFEITYLAAKGGLRGAKSFFGGECQASRLSNRDEIAKVAKFHGLVLPLKHVHHLTKSF
jgi:hypothetical protein